jgi:hypothetical protein
MASEDTRTEDEILDSVEDESVDEGPEAPDDDGKIVEEGEEIEVEAEEEKETENDDILKEFEEEEEKPTKEDEETFEGIPESATLTFKQIKSKFPDAIKQFPIIQNALFKKEQYEEVFPDVKSAQEASRRMGIYENLHRAILQDGDIKPVIQALKQSNPKALERLALGFTDVLDDVKLANLSAEPIIRRHLRLMQSEARASGNKNLELAARYTARYLYATPDGSIPEGSPKLSADIAPEVSEELKLLRSERENISNERFSAIQQGIVDEMESKLMNYISAHIKSDDPNVKIGEFTREAATKHALGKLVDKLSSDRAHVQRITPLWAQIKNNPRSASEMGPRLIRAVLGSAKPFLPALIAEAKSKALGTTSSKAKVDTSLSGGGGKGQTSINSIPKGLKSKDIDFSRTSEDDLINAALGQGGKIALRKRG